jgi:hypothetical protein
MINSAQGSLPDATTGFAIAATGYHLTAVAPLAAHAAKSAPTSQTAQGTNFLVRGAGAAVGLLGLYRDMQGAMAAINACYANYP